MKEIHEFRIFKDCYHLLISPNNAKFNGAVYVLKISKDDILFQEVEQRYRELRKKNNAFFSSWEVKRIYTKKELSEAKLFHFRIKTAFEPIGEDCGTEYDETVACEICGANRKQRSPLFLQKGSIPKKDIARTLIGEMVVSERFAEIAKQRGLKGISLNPVQFKRGDSKYYQLTPSSPELELTKQTIAGEHPFDLLSESFEATEFSVCGYKIKTEKVIVKCPKGHLIGGRLISEPYILCEPSISEYDFFATKQKTGAKIGVFYPRSVYLCSPAFRQMVIDEKLSGFDFEVAHIE
jgi:hypothetical protein